MKALKSRVFSEAAHRFVVVGPGRLHRSAHLVPEQCIRHEHGSRAAARERPVPMAQLPDRRHDNNLKSLALYVVSEHTKNKLFEAGGTCANVFRASRDCGAGAGREGALGEARRAPGGPTPASPRLAGDPRGEDRVSGSIEAAQPATVCLRSIWAQRATPGAGEGARVAASGGRERAPLSRGALTPGFAVGRATRARRERAPQRLERFKSRRGK